MPCQVYLLHLYGTCLQSDRLIEEKKKKSNSLQGSRKR